MPKEFIQKLTTIVEANLANEKFGPEELANEADISHSNLNRKLKSISKQTVSQFIREIRLKKGKELLQKEELTVAEISFRVGFGSPTYFSTCFHEYFGIAPGELRNRAPDIENDEQPAETKPKSSKRMKIMLWVVFGLIITITTVFLLIQKSTFSKEKSIAVLPFINYSQDAENLFFVNGLTESVTDKLAQIKDLKVTSRNSSEKYRDNKTKSTPRIGRELGVRYILEGSGQKIGDSVIVSVQLINARKDRHIYSHQYHEKYFNIFDLYTVIALDIASKIKALITPEEKKSIEKKPSEKIELTRMLIHGKELIGDINVNYKMTQEQIGNAETFYRKALEIDSTYSDAWRNLGVIYNIKGKTDSALIFLEKSLQFDSKNSETYLQKGIIYCGLHNAGEMYKSLKIAIKYNPDNAWAQHFMGAYYYYTGEFLIAFAQLIKTKEMLGELDSNTSSLNLRQMEGNTLHICRILFALGFYEEGKQYADLWYQLSNDDYRGYIYNLLWAGLFNLKFEDTYRIGEQNRDKADEIPRYHIYIGMAKLFENKYSEAAGFFKKGIELAEVKKIKQPDMRFLHGFAQLKTDNIAEAEKYFETTVNFYDTILITHPELKTPDHTYAITDRYWYFPYFILTCTWAARGNKENALENMRLLKQNYRANDLQVVNLLKYFPMLDNIRNEPEFQDYLKEAETHYNTEHKKVENLLREEGIQTNNVVQNKFNFGTVPSCI